MTFEEIGLLAKLAQGLFDGLVGDNLYTSGGSTVWTEIKEGVPTRYKQGPGGKFFDGKENGKYEGAIKVKEKWNTDDRKLEFLQKFGWLINDADAKKYSAAYKPKR